MRSREMLRVGEPPQGINYNERHPERHEDERFLENMSPKEFEELKKVIPSARKGEVAYTRRGKKAHEEGSEPESFPVFVANEDYEKAVDARSI